MVKKVKKKKNTHNTSCGLFTLYTQVMNKKKNTGIDVSAVF